MSRESIVEIPEGSGNQYRYAYNNDTGKTEYVGPVGSAPAIGETQFMAMMAESRKALSEDDWSELVSTIEDYQNRIKDYEKRITRKEREKMVIDRELTDLQDAKMKEESVLYQTYYKKIIEAYQDPVNWKNPIPRFKVPDMKTGAIARHAIAVFHGGAEFDPRTLEVWSKGYYEYIGA